MQLPLCIDALEDMTGGCAPLRHKLTASAAATALAPKSAPGRRTYLDQAQALLEKKIL
jgi:hypothetical protein